MRLNNIMPKVLIACPTSDRHKHLIDDWLKSLEKLTYPNFEVLLVDTTPENDDYFKFLKTKKIKGKELIIQRHKWDCKKDHVVQMLAKARDKIRTYFLENVYDNLFWLDDDIFIPENSIQRLVSYQKDAVGFYVHIYHGKLKTPCILKSGEIIMGSGLDFYSFEEIDAYKDYVKRLKENKLTKKEKSMYSFIIKEPFKPQLFKAYGVNIGCLMTSKKLMETVPFRSHKKFIFGEDLWFFTESNEKNFEFWCDTNVRPIHKNTEWNSVMIKGPTQGTEFFIAMGDSKADKICFLDRKNG